MKSMKTLISLLLAVVLIGTMAVALTACHPQNETAITVTDPATGESVTITSALYMCALIQADEEGRSKVDEAKTAAAEEAAAEEETDSDDTSSVVAASSDTSSTNYYKETITDEDGTAVDFSDWVKNRAKEICVEYATYQLLFQQAGLSLEESQETIDMYVDYYWDSYGYSTLYGANGVGEDTFRQYFAYSYMQQDYFTYLYDTEDLDTYVSEADANACAVENFQLLDTLQMSYTYTDADGTSVSYSDEEIALIQADAQSYVDGLNNGTMSFDDVYLAYNGTEPTASDGSTPSYASVYASETAAEASSYYSTSYYETGKNLTVGQATLVHDEDNGYSVVLFKEQEIADNSEVLTSLRNAALYILKEADFEDLVAAASEGYTVNVNSFAVDRFKPKKIDYLESAS